jgi:hypothetical protein
MVIAPNRKKRIPAISDKCSIKVCTIKCDASVSERLKIPLLPIEMSTQQMAAVKRAEAALSSFKGCSRAMAT